jgi:glycosyltransferase involved in cell wall biosynthesis
MNITQVNMNDTGGAFQAVYRLQQGLRHENINSNCLVLYKYKKGLEHVYPFIDKPNILSKLKYSVEFRITQKKIKKLTGSKPKVEFRFPFSPFKIHEHELIKKADIVHFHWLAKFLDYASFFKNINKPVVWTLHDLHPIGGGFHYDSYVHPAYTDLNNITINAKIAALANVKNLHIVTLSHWLHTKSINSEILGRFPHHYIPNGLDTTVFKPYKKQEARAYFNLPQNKKIILFVADSLEDKRKGFVYLQDALRYLDAESVFLITLGNGKIDDTLFPSKCLGFISDPLQIAMAYSAADVFVIPSIEDNLPNSVMESIACGTPVVGFNIGGIPDMIRHGENGFLATLGDSIDLAQKVNQILNNDELSSHMSTNARRIAEQEYSQELQTKRHIELYNTILDFG